MSSGDSSLKRKLIHYSKKLYDRGLAVGPGGNVSVRSGDVMYIKPSGFSMDELTEDVIIAVDINTLKVVEGSYKPSSETPLHALCYRARSDVNAVVHVHPPYCIALSAAGRGELINRALYPDHVIFIGRVAAIEYVTPTTMDFGRIVAEKAGEGYNCILLQNHGTVTLGSTLKEAVFRAEVLEESAKILWLTLMLGKPRFLTDEEVTELEGLSTEKYRRELLKRRE